MKKTISGYTQSYNLKSQHYPWIESITSLLGFCDEVIIVDGGSTDGTYEDLIEISKKYNKIKLFQIKRDWNSEGSSLFDGMQKAEARKKCSGDWCFQMDVDEVIHEKDYDNIINIAQNCPDNVKLLAFPFVEFWGLKGKIRCDIFPVKGRMSRNTNITHGIPINQRKYTSSGRLYSTGSDGCDYIRSDTFEIVNQNIIFDYDKMFKIQSIVSNFKNLNYAKEYEFIYNNIISNIPTVFHYSWSNLYKKIKAYKNFWQKHWNDLYNKNIEDISENNMFFNKPWNEVSDDEIKNISIELENKMCGWIFHSKIDFSKPFPNIYFKGNHPEIMKEWIKNNE